MADLVKYLAFLTHADHGDSTRSRARYDGVLRHATLEEMWRPVVPLAAAGGLDEAFGLSFYLYRRGDRTIVGHTGEQSGFRTFFFLDPASTTAVVGVVNTTNEARPDASAAGWDALTRGGRGAGGAVSERRGRHRPDDEREPRPGEPAPFETPEAVLELQPETAPAPGYARTGPDAFTSWSS